MVIAHITKYLAFTTYILQGRGTKIEKLMSKYYVTVTLTYTSISATLY